MGGVAAPDVKQALGFGVQVLFQNTASTWSEGEYWQFTIPSTCTCDAGYFNSDAGECSSKCDKGYEAGHFRCGATCDHGPVYAGLCICDVDRTGATCEQTCSTSQPHQHCKFGDRRSELLEIISNTELVCRAPPQQLPTTAGVTVDVSLMKSNVYTGSTITSKESEYTSSGMTVQV